MFVNNCSSSIVINAVIRTDSKTSYYSFTSFYIKLCITRPINIFSIGNWYSQENVNILRWKQSMEVKFYAFEISKNHQTCQRLIYYKFTMKSRTFNIKYMVLYSYFEKLLLAKSLRITVTLCNRELCYSLHSVLFRKN